MEALSKDLAEETFLTASKICCPHLNLFPEESRFVSMKLDLLADRKSLPMTDIFILPLQSPARVQSHRARKQPLAFSSWAPDGAIQRFGSGICSNTTVIKAAGALPSEPGWVLQPSVLLAGGWRRSSPRSHPD